MTVVEKFIEYIRFWSNKLIGILSNRLSVSFRLFSSQFFIQYIGLFEVEGVADGFPILAFLFPESLECRNSKFLDSSAVHFGP